MKPYFRRAILVTVAASLLGGMGVPARSEVSITIDSNAGDRPHLLLMHRDITDGIDPIPQVSWEPYRPLTAGFLLNPDGSTRPDGPPDVAWHPTTAQPYVVWAYNNGNDHDVTLATWTGASWSNELYLTASLEDEVDPQVFVQRDGTVHVVFWIDGGDRRVSHLMRLPATDYWTVPSRVTPSNEVGRRPTVAVHGGFLWVAYERDGSAGASTAQELVIRRRAADGPWEDHHVVGVPRLGAFHPKFQVIDAKLWLSWQHTETHHAWVEFGGPNWSPLQQMAWSDETWIGIETARKLIANQIGNNTLPVEPDDPGTTAP